jgi:hypothetical protein
MKIQPPLEYLPASERGVRRLEGLSPSGQLALQRLSEVTSERIDNDKADTLSAQPVPTVGAYIDIKV